MSQNNSSPLLKEHVEAHNSGLNSLKGLEQLASQLEEVGLALIEKTKALEERERALAEKATALEERSAALAGEVDAHMGEHRRHRQVMDEEVDKLSKRLTALLERLRV